MVRWNQSACISTAAHEGTKNQDGLEVHTERSRAQNEAKAPPMEWPTTFMGSFPYVFHAHLIDFNISCHRVVL